MSAPLKCPNPSCPFLFDPSQVPPGALLSCPRCRHQFTLNLNDPNQQTEGMEAAIADESTSLEHGIDFERSSEPQQNRPRKRGSGFGGAIVVIVGVVLVFGMFAAVALYAFSKREKFVEPVQTASSEVVVKDLNFAYDMPTETWSRDDAASRIKREMKVTAFALHRDKPEAWAALSVTDYHDRKPLEIELLRKMTEHLGNIFQDVPSEIRGESVQWAGHDATRYGFRLLRLQTDVPCVGECTILVHQGIAYYFYTWAAEDDVATVATEFDDLRGRFRLLNLRKDWQPSRANEILLTVPESAFVLTTYENIWEQPPGLTAKDADPRAELYRIGKLPSRARGDFVPEAELLVLVVEKPGDPMTVADAIVRERNTPDAELFQTETRITDETGPVDPDVDPAIGPEVKTIEPMRLLFEPENAEISRSLRKFVVYSAIRVGDQVIIAEAKCPASERSVWENRLIQLVGSLRER